MASKKITVKTNIKLLVEKEPEVKDNYNLLITRYWEKFEQAHSLQDVFYCTSAESISRAFRSLVRTGEIELSKGTKKVRKREEQDFRQHYGQEVLSS